MSRYFDIEIGTWTRNGYPCDLHIWVGPVGLHLFWPNFWKSRAEWAWGVWR